MTKDNGTFCGEPLLNLSTRGIGHVQQCSQVKYIQGIPKKGTVDGLNIKDGYVYVDGVKQELFDLKVDSWQDVWNSEYLQDLRYKQANGIKNPTCELCYFMKGHSKRARYITDADYYRPLYKEESPNKLELRLSNECNLSCRFCTPINSSIYEKEMIKLSKNEKNIPDIVKKNYVAVAERVYDLKQKGVKFLRDTVDNLQELLHNVRIIEIHGGEPTLETKLWEVLENLDLSDKEFICYSNIIQLTDYHIEILNRFRAGRFIASIDVADESISYIRYPAKWEVVSQNAMMLKQFKPEIEIQISMTFQIYNMFRIANSIKWVVENFKDCDNHKPKFSVIQKPAYLSPNLVDYKDRISLAESIRISKNNLFQGLSKKKRKIYERSLDEVVDYLKIEKIENSIPDVTSYIKGNNPKQIRAVLIRQFWEFTRTLDKSRRQDFLTVYPEFKGKL